MTKVQLNQKEQHYADTPEEAEEIVVKAKENIYLTMNKVSEKHNKMGTYFLVDLTYSYNTPKEVMESAPDKESEHGEQHEGIEVTANGDGTFQVDPNQISIDDVDSVVSADEKEVLNDEVPF